MQFGEDLLSTSSLAEVVMPWISQVYLPMSDMVGLWMVSFWTQSSSSVVIEYFVPRKIS